MEVTDKNSVELTEVNALIQRLNQKLKEENLLLSDHSMTLKKIRGKYYLDTLTFEATALNPENRHQDQRQINSFNQQQNLFCAIPIRTVEPPAERNSIDVYSQLSEQQHLNK